VVEGHQHHDRPAQQIDRIETRTGVQGGLHGETR